MMLGGVGFQAGLDEARRKEIEARSQAVTRSSEAPDLVEQLKDLKVLLDDGALSPEEFQLAKQRVLG